MPRDDVDKVVDAMASKSAAGPVPREKMGMKDFQKVLDSTPLFMKETPEDGEENEVMEALKSLMFEGDGDDVALNFKNHGNELYAHKSYKDAIEAYTQGLDAKPQSQELQISLLNNRAACNLYLKNYGAVLRDTGVIIALSGDKPPPKAMYRSAQSLIALERWDQAADCVARGMGLIGEEDNKVWVGLGEQVERGRKRFFEKVERERREKVGKEALRRAVASRGLIILNTDKPPDNPNPLDFDTSTLPPSPPLYTSPTPTTPTPEKWYPPPPHHPLIFPVFLLYPQHNTSDLITHFHEDTSFEDQLSPIFPTTSPPEPGSPPWSEWDTKHEYWIGNLTVYVETSQKRLLKVGKEITLREVIAKARKEVEGEPPDGIVLRDGLLSFIVLVRGKEEREWIDNFKKVRDQSR